MTLRQLVAYGATGGGLLALIAAVRLPWTQVPGNPLTAQAGVISLEPAITRYYQFGCLAVALGMISLRYFGFRRNYPICTLAASWLVALLIYPYFVTVWDVRVSSQAAWLQLQHDNMTWLGGDIASGAEFFEAPLKERVYLVDPPRRLTILNIPVKPVWDMELSNLSDLFDWLGYTEGFCQFCRRGWFVALFGTMAILAACCMADRETHRVRVVHGVRVMVALGLLAVTTAWSLPFVAGAHVRRAEKLVRQGDFAGALAQLETAAAWMPILRHDTYFVAQTGRLQSLIGQKDQPEAKLYLASCLEGDGRFAEANQTYRAVIQQTEPGDACRREACRALLRDAIHSLNSGRNNAAIDQLQEILSTEPTNLKANFTLQLACIRTGHGQDLDQWIEQITQVYSYFQTPIKQTILAMGFHNQFVAALEKGDARSARTSQLRSISP